MCKDEMKNVWIYLGLPRWSPAQNPPASAGRCRKHRFSPLGWEDALEHGNGHSLHWNCNTGVVLCLKSLRKEVPGKLHGATESAKDWALEHRAQICICLEWHLVIGLKSMWSKCLPYKIAKGIYYTYPSAELPLPWLWGLGLISIKLNNIRKN